jgi:hypothetical protein
MSSYVRVGAAAGDEYTWRDSTDGNRITTTRGDKIEVIGGNYELTVLGRRQHESGMRAEQGRINQDAITYRGTVKVQGARLLEETVKGDVCTTYHGDVVDEYYGSRVESRTGSESPAELRENPVIEDRTWAKRIGSYRGSARLRVNEIEQVTWAAEMESLTDTKSSEDQLVVAGELGSTTKARTITSETKAGSIRDETTVTGNIERETRASEVVSTTRADTQDTTYGDTVSYQQGNTSATVEGTESTANLGLVNEVVLGMMTEVTVGAETAVTAGGSLNVHIGAEAAITVGPRADIKIAEIEMKPSEIKLHLDRMKTALFRKSVAAVNLLA